MISGFQLTPSSLSGLSFFLFPRETLHNSYSSAPTAPLYWDVGCDG